MNEQALEQLVEACKEAVQTGDHDEACQFWKANVRELETKSGRAKWNDRCDCWKGTLRHAMIAAGLPDPLEE